MTILTTEQYSKVIQLIENRQFELEDLGDFEGSSQESFKRSYLEEWYEKLATNEDEPVPEAILDYVNSVIYGEELNQPITAERVLTGTSPAPELPELKVSFLEQAEVLPLAQPGEIKPKVATEISGSTPSQLTGLANFSQTNSNPPFSPPNFENEGSKVTARPNFFSADFHLSSDEYNQMKEQLAQERDDLINNQNDLKGYKLRKELLAELDAWYKTGATTANLKEPLKNYLLAFYNLSQAGLPQAEASNAFVAQTQNTPGRNGEVISPAGGASPGYAPEPTLAYHHNLAETPALLNFLSLRVEALAGLEQSPAIWEGLVKAKAGLEALSHQPGYLEKSDELARWLEHLRQNLQYREQRLLAAIQWLGEANRDIAQGNLASGEHSLSVAREILGGLGLSEWPGLLATQWRLKNTTTFIEGLPGNKLREAVPGETIRKAGPSLAPQTDEALSQEAAIQIEETLSLLAGLDDRENCGEKIGLWENILKLAPGSDQHRAYLAEFRNNLNRLLAVRKQLITELVEKLNPASSDLERDDLELVENLRKLRLSNGEIDQQLSQARITRLNWAKLISETNEILKTCFDPIKIAQVQHTLSLIATPWSQQLIQQLEIRRTQHIERGIKVTTSLKEDNLAELSLLLQQMRAENITEYYDGTQMQPIELLQAQEQRGADDRKLEKALVETNLQNLAGSEQIAALNRLTQILKNSPNASPNMVQKVRRHIDEIDRRLAPGVERYNMICDYLIRQRYLAHQHGDIAAYNQQNIILMEFKSWYSRGAHQSELNPALRALLNIQV